MGSSQYGELIQTVLDRIELLETLQGDPQDWTTLLDAVDLSRGTVDTTLSEFQQADLVQEREDGYTLTGAGQLLVDSYHAQLGDTVTESQIDLIEKRDVLLDRVAQEPHYKRDLVDETNASRSTVYRAIDTLEDAGLVEKQTDGWVTTDQGERALAAYRAFMRDAETILSARTLLEALPAEATIPLDVLSANEVQPHADQYEFIDQLGERIQSADRYRAILPQIEGSRHVRLCHSLVTRHGGTMELLAPADVLVHLREEFPYLSAELAQSDGFQAYQCETPPFGLLLLTQSEESTNETATDQTATDQTTTNTATPAVGEQTTTSTIVVYDEHGIRGFVDGTADDTVAWAREFYENVRFDSQPATETLETAATDSELPRLSGERLPLQVRSAGFTRLDEEFFAQREPLPPATAWRAGIGFPEIEASYAVPRSDGAEQTMTAQIFDRLAAGDDLALLGPPGSGKSTVAKRVAHRWYDREQGTVLYRESGQGEAFESPGALETLLDRIDEPVLIVVEDAVRADAHEIFDVMQTFSGQDDVTFLLDARESEWHDVDTLPTDSRLVAFRDQHLDTVHMPALDETDCQRLIDRVESLTESSISVSATELLSTVRETAHDTAEGEDETNPGLAFLLFHQLSRYIDPLTGTGKEAVSTRLVEHVEKVRTDLTAMGQTELEVGVVANVLNAAGIDLDPAYLQTPGLSEEGSYEAVRAALDRLEGDILFQSADEDSYRTIHEMWSVEFLSQLLEAAGEQAARDHVGEAITRVLSLATDTERRREIAGQTGETPALERITVSPGEWTDRIVDRVFELGRTRPKLAPLFAANGTSRIDLPSTCNSDLSGDVQVWLGKMLRVGGYYDRAESALERIPLDDDRLAPERLLGLTSIALGRGNYGTAEDHAKACLDRTEHDLEVKGRVLRLLGRVFARRSEYDQAKEYYEESLAIRREIGDRSGESTSLNNLGLVAKDRGAYDRAQEYFEESLAIKREIGDRYGESELFINLGNIAESRGSYDRAKEYYEESLAIKRKIGHHNGEAATLNNLGVIAYQHGAYDRAKEYFEESLVIREEIGHPKGEATALNNLGRIAHLRGAYDQTQEYYEKSLAIEREIGDKRGQAASLHNLGIIAKDRGAYDQATEYYEKSLATRREIGDRKGEAQTLDQLGNLSRYLGAYDQAREYYKRSLAIFEEIGGRNGEAVSLNNLGTIAKDRGLYDQAREYYEESLAIRREIGDRKGEAASLNNLGQIAKDRGAFDRAREYYEESIAIRKEIGDRKDEAASLNNLGQIAKHCERPEQATELLTDALDNAREHGFPEVVLESLRELGAVAHRQGAYDTAAQHLTDALAVSETDELQRQRAKTHLERARLALDRENMEKSRQALDQAHSTFWEIDASHDEARATLLRGRLAARTDSPEQAREHFEAALDSFEEIGAPQDTLTTLRQLVELCHEQDAHERARKWTQQAQTVLEDAPDATASLHRDWVEQPLDQMEAR